MAGFADLLAFGDVVGFADFLALVALAFTDGEAFTGAEAFPDGAVVALVNPVVREDFACEPCITTTVTRAIASSIAPPSAPLTSTALRIDGLGLAWPERGPDER